MSEASIEALSERFDQFIQSPGARWDEWRTLREDIISEHAAAPGAAARVLCLSMHQILKDVVEPTIGAEHPEWLAELIAALTREP